MCSTPAFTKSARLPLARRGRRDLVAGAGREGHSTLVSHATSPWEQFDDGVGPPDNASEGRPRPRSSPGPRLWGQRLFREAGLRMCSSAQRFSNGASVFSMYSTTASKQGRQSSTGAAKICAVLGAGKQESVDASHFGTDRGQRTLLRG